MYAPFVSFLLLLSSLIPAGHSVWGINQGPATGKGLAELIVNGESKCVDLSPFGLELY
jgi:glycine/D-amino acid oxidase-like deaminating enzyme